MLSTWSNHIQIYWSKELLANQGLDLMSYRERTLIAFRGQSIRMLVTIEVYSNKGTW